MNQEELRELRKEITAIIDDIKYQSDSLTDLERLPVIQLKVILAKVNKLHEHSTILLHYVEKQGKLSDRKEVKDEVFKNELEVSKEMETPEPKIEEEQIEEAPEKQIEEVRKEAPLESQAETPKPSSSKNVEDKLKKIVVTDLNAAIGINEKYLYAGELFKGDTVKLKEVILKINDMNDPETVNAYLNDLNAEYSWDKENTTVQNFIELIERKFDQF